MKLYTEEDLLKAIQLGRNYGGWITTEPEILKQLTPIELPSDEEIEEVANTRLHYEGAMWLKQQILKQNK